MATSTMAPAFGKRLRSVVPGLRMQLMLLVAMGLLPAAVLVSLTAIWAGPEADRVFLLNVSALAVVAVSAFGAAWVVADGFILRPVERILVTTRRLAAGNLSARTELQTRGEVGELAHAFDEMADSLERQHEELKAMARVRTQLLNTASHELNTPITPIKMQLHLLKSGALGPLTARQTKAVVVLDRNVERLALLVQDILDVARIQSGKLAVRRTRVDLRGLATETVDTFRAYAANAQVALDLGSSESPLVVDADERRLVQVFSNLVSNAIKFTPPGGRVVLEVGAEGGDAVAAVRDTGIGLTGEQIGRLFSPFVQVHDTSKLAVGGTGLGLYIAKGIVEQHRGTLECRSAGAGTGAAFFVRLPLAKEPGPV